MLYLRFLLVFTFAFYGTSARAQLENEWLGKWKGNHKSTFEVSRNRLVYGALACDEGRCIVAKPVPCSWSRDGQAIKRNPGNGSCRFGEMSQKRSRDEIIKDFDTAAAKAVKDNPRLAREMKINRKQLGQMKVGMFRVLALDAFSDFTELIFDGHHIFQLNAWGGVEIYSRVKY